MKDLRRSDVFTWDLIFQLIKGIKETCCGKRTFWKSGVENLKLCMVIYLNKISIGGERQHIAVMGGRGAKIYSEGTWVEEVQISTGKVHGWRCKILPEKCN